MGALNTTVHVHEVPFGETQTVFGPGDDVPEWAARQMGAHCFEDGEHPYPAEDPDSKPTASAKEREAGTPPPRQGAGSTKDAWVAYAYEKGVTITPDLGRDGIIEAVAAAGVPVDPQPQQ